jgi:hypothetical protein
VTDVILQLGEPDSTSADESQLAYRSEKVTAWWSVVVGGGYYADEAHSVIYHERFYIFEFDPSGRFASARLERDGSMVQNLGRAELRPCPLPSRQVAGVPAIVGGEPVVCEHLHSIWFAGVDGYQSKGAYSATGKPGRLALTESNLVFLSHAQFANAEPALKLPLSTIANVRLAKNFIGSSRIALRTQAGENHSFEILGPYEILKDKTATQAAFDFIRSKIKPTQIEK